MGDKFTKRHDYDEDDEEDVGADNVYDENINHLIERCDGNFN